MEFIAYLVLAGFIFACSVVLALIATAVTRRFERGRGAIVLAAFFAPSVFTAYLLFASYLRNEFHYDRLEASNFDGSCTLPLGNGYNLTFFDEVPTASSIGKGDWQKLAPISLSRVQRVAQAGHYVFGQTSTSDWPKGPVDFFFSLDLSSGEIRKFGDEAILRQHAPRFGSLVSPDEAFWATQRRQQSKLFWPVVAGAPFAMFAGYLYLIRRNRTKKPTLDDPENGLSIVF
jgi:hypothetical protein